MKSEVIQEIRRLRGKGYSVNDVARLTGTTADQVRLAMRTQSHGNTEKDETEVIDGELVQDRVERLKKEIQTGKLVIKRESK